MSRSCSSTGWCAVHGAIRKGFNFPQTVQFNPSAVLPEIMPDVRPRQLGFRLRAGRRGAGLWFLMRSTLKGFEVKVLGQSPRAGRFAGFSSSRMVCFAFLLSGALAGLAGISEVSGAIGQLQPVDLARLRLHRHHRRLPRPPQSARHRRRRAGAGADLSRRRGGADVRSASPTRWRASSRACCCSSCSPATR